MSVRFNSLFDIYPDTLRKGAVVGYRKTDGSMLQFPCTLETGNAVRDVRGRWTASALGLNPVVVKYSGALKRMKAVEAWISDGFSMNPVARYTIENATLERVRFIDGVTEIGKRAFCNYKALSDITIPDSVMEIGTEAFEGCTGLKSITIPEGVTSIRDFVFYGCTGLSNITIPDSVTEIGISAFVCCTSLKSITIPESVTKIGCSAFCDCKNLSGIMLPDGVTEIEAHAFYGCSGLTGINIPDSVTAIGHQAFQFCTGLTGITIPSSVKEIGIWAFRGCTGLTDIYVDQPESDLLDNEKIPAGCTVHWKQEAFGHDDLQNAVEKASRQEYSIEGVHTLDRIGERFGIRTQFARVSVAGESQTVMDEFVRRFRKSGPVHASAFIENIRSCAEDALIVESDPPEIYTEKDFCRDRDDLVAELRNRLTDIAV